MQRASLSVKIGNMKTKHDRERRGKVGRPRNHSRYGWHGGALRLRRLAYGYSAEHVAALITEATGDKVSRGAIGCWERGEHHPESRTVEALAVILLCEPWELGRAPVVDASGSSHEGEGGSPHPRHELNQ